MNVLGRILEVKGLVAGYGDARILHGVSAYLETGEIAVVIGPNGAGKSTLIKAIAGLIKPESGQVTLDGRDVTGLAPQTIVGMGMSYVPQVRNTFPSLTVRENLEMGVYVLNYGASGYLSSALASVNDGMVRGALRVGGFVLEYLAGGPLDAEAKVLAHQFRTRFFRRAGHRYYSTQRVPASVVKERIDRVLEVFPALKGRLTTRAGNLSGGQQQMVALARAMMLDPKVLLIDEPSAGLAPNLVDAIFARIAAINEHGTAIFLVEQNARKALKLAARGYVLEMGKNRFEDRADRILSNPEIGKLYLGG